MGAGGRAGGWLALGDVCPPSHCCLHLPCMVVLACEGVIVQYCPGVGVNHHEGPVSLTCLVVDGDDDQVNVGDSGGRYLLVEL